MSGRTRSPSPLRALVSSLVPPSGLQRVLVLQTATFSFGEGLYTTGSVIFFTVYLGLGATQVTLGLSVFGIVTMACWMPFGMLADRVGGRVSWMLGALVQALVFACFPLVQGFAGFVTAIAFVGLGVALCSTGRARYMGDAVPEGHRVRATAYLSSVFNAGSAIGAASAGLLVAFRSKDVMVAFVLVNALTFFIDFLLLALCVRTTESPAAPAAERPKGRRALGDRPFVVLSLVTGVFAMSDTLLIIVLPLWILQRTDAPSSLVPALVLVNTLLVVLLQVRVSAGAEGVTGAAGSQVRAGLLLALSCALVPVTLYSSDHWTALATVAVVVVLTFGELFSSASSWGLSYGLSPELRRGEYLALFEWSERAMGIVAPVGLTALALTGWGWFVIAAVFAAAGLATRPVAAWAARTREEQVSALTA